MAVQSGDRRIMLDARRAAEAAGRSEAKRLSGRIAWPTIALFVGILLGLGTASALALHGEIPLWSAMAINALLSYAIFTPVHEAIHGNIAGRHKTLQWINQLIGHVGGFILLAPYPGFADLHIRHHQCTNHPALDPDYWVKGRNIFDVLLRCLGIHLGYILHLCRLATDDRGKRVLAEEVAYVALFGAVVAGAYWAGCGPELMLLWVLPAYTGLVICPLVFDWVVHQPHSRLGRYENASILLFPRPLRVLLDAACFGQSYHLIHHLYPRVPFYAYRSVYQTVAGALPKLGAPVRQLGSGTSPPPLLHGRRSGRTLRSPGSTSAAPGNGL